MKKRVLGKPWKESTITVLKVGDAKVSLKTNSGSHFLCILIPVNNVLIQKTTKMADYTLSYFCELGLCSESGRWSLHVHPVRNCDRWGQHIFIQRLITWPSLVLILSIFNSIRSETALAHLAQKPVPISSLSVPLQDRDIVESAFNKSYIHNNIFLVQPTVKEPPVSVSLSSELQKHSHKTTSFDTGLLISHIFTWN